MSIFFKLKLFFKNICWHFIIDLTCTYFKSKNKCKFVLTITFFHYYGELEAIKIDNLSLMKNHDPLV